MNKVIFPLFAVLYSSLLVFAGPLEAIAPGSLHEQTRDEKKLLYLFEDFDYLYWMRQTHGASSGEKWMEMRQKLSDYLRIPEKNLSQEWIPFRMQHQVAMSFFLRAALLMGECDLFASQEYFKKEDETFRTLYERGINTLHQVILASANLTEKHHKTKDEVDYLPDYSHYKEIKSHEGTYRVTLHPFVGRETIGTGLEEHATIRDRRTTYEIQPYADLSELKEDIVKDLASQNRIRQISTTAAARSLLSVFCPWGVEIYFWLKAANLARDIDFRILRPYAQGLDKNLHTKLLNNLEWLVSSRGKYTSLWEISPLISELSLPPGAVSPTVKAEMDCVVDTEDCLLAHDGRDELRAMAINRCKSIRSQNKAIGPAGLGDVRDVAIDIHVDRVGDLGNKKIRWLWVGDPTYNIWYVSPTLYNWTAADYAKMAFSIYSWACGGVVWGTVSYGVGQVGSKITNQFFDYFKTSPVPIPFFSNILTEGVKDQYSSLVSGEKVSATGTIKAQKWLDSKNLFMDLTGYVFESLESSQLEALFGGIDPKDIKMGTSYNGARIPPVLLVSNVAGVQDVPEMDYPNLITMVRFYVMQPQYNDQLIAYDYRTNPLLGARMQDLCLGWSKTGSPFRSTTITTSLAPSAQILKFKLDMNTAKSIRDKDSVKMELWATTLGEEHKYATATIAPGDSLFVISLYNKAQPSGKRGYKEALSSPGETFVMATAANTIRDIQARKGEYHTALVPLKTQYELKMKVNGRYVSPAKGKERYLINLYAGPRGAGRERKPVTGALSASPLDPRFQELDYEKVIRLPIGKVGKESLQQGETPATSASDT